MKISADAPIFSDLLSNLDPKNSGMVAESRCCVIIRVLLPRTTHASSDPMMAFPRPIQVDAIPYFHPNCPAYPTNTTAEK